MNAARVRSGIVINVEVIKDAEAKTLSVALEECNLGHQHAEEEQLIPYTDDNAAHIGYGYDPELGFEQPPQEEEISHE